MYEPYRQEKQVDFKIMYDSNTARGFGLSLLITFALILLSSLTSFEKPAPYEFKKLNTIPIEILNFGDGEGTGISKGNLSKEGIAQKGSPVTSELEDASKSGKTKFEQNFQVEDPIFANRLIPKDVLTSSEQNKSDGTGSGTKTVGSPNGSPEGTGLGQKGTGTGAGLGFGDIEWGGGGNRSVVQKKLPKYPPGVNTAAQIRIRFVVSPDGTVKSMLPLQKGDPLLEKAAMDALRQWRFNPLKEQKEMFGIITFTFRLS